MKHTVDDNAMMQMDGHVLIRDKATGEILLNKHNAINFYNMSIAIASLLANKTDSSNGDLGFHIATMAFGNGGTVIDGVGNVFYKEPNVGNITDALYAETYSKDVTQGTTENNVDVSTYEGQVYSDIIVTATLEYAEPAGQNTIDNDTGSGDYVFDEIALVTESGRYLTHLIFHPIEKSANRHLEIIYTVRINAGS